MQRQARQSNTESRLHLGAHLQTNTSEHEPCQSLISPRHMETPPGVSTRFSDASGTETFGKQSTHSAGTSCGHYVRKRCVATLRVFTRTSRLNQLSLAKPWQASASLCEGFLRTPFVVTLCGQASCEHFTLWESLCLTRGHNHIHNPGGAEGFPRKAG